MLAFGRKGGESSRLSVERYGSVDEANVVERGRSGAGEKTEAVRSSVSKSRICVRAAGESHGGGEMLARRWRLSSRASQRGRGAGKGGFRACVGPCVKTCHSGIDQLH